MKCKLCGLHRNCEKQFSIQRRFGEKIKIVFIDDYSSYNPYPKIRGKQAQILKQLLIELKIKMSNISVIPIIWCQVLDKDGKPRVPLLPEYIMCSENIDKYISMVKPKVVVSIGKDLKSYVTPPPFLHYTMISFENLIKSGGIVSSRFDELVADLKGYLK